MRKWKVTYKIVEYKSRAEHSEQTYDFFSGDSKLTDKMTNQIRDQLEQKHQNGIRISEIVEVPISWLEKRKLKKAMKEDNNW